MRIQQRVFLSILVVTVPILIFSGIFSYHIAEQQIKLDVLIELDTIASIEKSRISEAIDRNYERLDGITSRTQLRMSLSDYLDSPNIQDQEKINKILIDAKFSIPDITEIHYVDLDGKVLFSTEDKYVGKDFLNSPIFIDSQDKNTVHVISDDHNDWVLYISGPLSLNDEILGIILVETTLNLFKKIAQETVLFHTSGEIIIAIKDDKGDARIITPLRYADNSKLIIPKENIDDQITRSLMQNPSAVTESVDYRGEPVFSATRYIENADWGITIILDKQEVLLSLLKIQFTIMFSIILLVAFSILISLSISNSISRPIKKLKLATKEITAGHLNEKIDTSGNDEISDLASDINIMKNGLESAQKKVMRNERLSAIGELSSRLSHDIRSPLSVIKMSVGLMKKTGKNLDEAQISKLDSVDRSASKIQYLVENILDFIRTREPKKEKTSIVEIIKSAKNFIHIPENIKIILPPNDIEIFCDSNQIEIVLENLLTNSIQAIGGTEGTITINIHEENNSIIILIQDSGPGIPEELIPEIFDPLFTTKMEGTGLGLASCKSIINSHDGTLTVSNNPTIFKITIPKNPKN